MAEMIDNDEDYHKWLEETGLAERQILEQFRDWLLAKQKPTEADRHCLARTEMNLEKLRKATDAA